MHKSLLEARAAIKMPTHLVLVSLLHEAARSGIPLQDLKKKKKRNTGIYLCAETTAPICFSGEWPACCLFWLSVAHWHLTAPNPAAKPYPWVLLSNHGHRFGVNPLTPHWWGTPEWQETCWNWQWKMFQHRTAKATDSLKLAVTASIF